MRAVVVNLEELTYRKGMRDILKNISWEIAQGEKWLILGNNGSGKTTLASILAGYQSCTGGELQLFFQTIDDHNRTQLRSHIGFASASYFNNFFSEELVLDVVLGGLNGVLGRVEPILDSDVLRAKKILCAFGLAQKIRHPYNLLSRGQQQKVMLSRSLMSRGNFYIFDEPCEGLDILSRAFFSNTVRKMLCDKQITLIYITHHTEEMIFPGFSHVLLLKNGCVHSCGKIEEVLTNKNMSNFFEIGTEVIYEKSGIQFHIDMQLALKDCYWKQER